MESTNDSNVKDPLYVTALAIVLDRKRVSISMVQRELRIDYNRAARLIEEMEVAGKVTSPNADGTREIIRNGDAS